MFQSAIFDLDGTLINSLPDIAGAMNRSLAKCGLPGFQVEDYRLKVGNGVFKIAERSVGIDAVRLDVQQHAWSDLRFAFACFGVCREQHCNVQQGDGKGDDCVQGAAVSGACACSRGIRFRRRTAR